MIEHMVVGISLSRVRTIKDPVDHFKIAVSVHGQRPGNTFLVFVGKPVHLFISPSRIRVGGHKLGKSSSFPSGHAVQGLKETCHFMGVVANLRRVVNTQNVRFAFVRSGELQE